MSLAGRRQLLSSYRDGLLADTLPFWFPKCVDMEHGGFHHCLDRDGSLLDSDKSVWAQGRMSWMLLTLFNTVERKPEWLEWARRGLNSTYVSTNSINRRRRTAPVKHLQNHLGGPRLGFQPFGSNCHNASHRVDHQRPHI